MFTDKQLLAFGILALVIAGIVRALNSDLPGPTISARWRPVIAAVLGQIGAVLAAVFAGMSVKAAIAGGLAASGLASLGHGFVKKTVLGMPEKKATPSDPPNVAGIVLAIAVGSVLAQTAFALGCSPSPATQAVVKAEMQADIDVAAYKVAIGKCRTISLGEYDACRGDGGVKAECKAKSLASFDVCACKEEKDAGGCQ